MKKMFTKQYFSSLLAILLFVCPALKLAAQNSGSLSLSGAKIPVVTGSILSRTKTLTLAADGTNFVLADTDSAGNPAIAQYRLLGTAELDGGLELWMQAASAVTDPKTTSIKVRFNVREAGKETSVPKTLTADTQLAFRVPRNYFDNIAQGYYLNVKAGDLFNFNPEDEETSSSGNGTGGGTNRLSQIVRDFTGLDTLSAYFEYKNLMLFDKDDNDIVADEHTFTVSAAIENAGAYIDFNIHSLDYDHGTYTYTETSGTTTTTYTATRDFVNTWSTDKTSGSGVVLSKYYGWFNWGNFGFKMGLFDSRRINLLDQDKPYGMEDFWYDRFKPGVINGTFGVDSLNLNKTFAFTTTTYKSYIDDDSGKIKSSSFELKDAVAANGTYTFDSLGPIPGSLAITGALVEGKWSNISGDDTDEKTVNASLAGELAYSLPDVSDFLFNFRSINTDDFSLAAFVQPQFLKPWGIDITAGYTFARLDHVHRDAHNEYGIDFRMRWQATDRLSFTTMHNFSHQHTWADSDVTYRNSKNEVKYNLNAHDSKAMWNMLSASFQGTKDIRLILTGEFLNANFNARADNTITFFPALEIACTSHIFVSWGNVFTWEAVGTNDAERWSMQLPVVLTINY